MLSLDGISAVLGDKAQERERIHPCNVCDKAFMSMQMLSQQKCCSKVYLPARVVARISTPTSASTDTISLCVASLTTGRDFSTSPSGARTTIQKIILNLNVLGEEENKREALASSRKRADIIYPLKWKYIVVVPYIFCVIFFNVLSHDF